MPPGPERTPACRGSAASRRRLRRSRPSSPAPVTVARWRASWWWSAAGNMGEALLGGLLRPGWADAGRPGRGREPGRRAGPSSTARSPASPCADRAARRRRGRGGRREARRRARPRARPLADAGVRRVLSIAAGVPHRGARGRARPAEVAVVRAMPNTPALVGAGAAAIAAGTTAGDDDLAWAESILGGGRHGRAGARAPARRGDRPVGLGPAYVFLVAEALIDAGVVAGLPRDDRGRARRPAAGRVGRAARRVGPARRPSLRAAGHLAGRHDRRRACARSSGPACGPRSSTPCVDRHRRSRQPATSAQSASSIGDRST